MNDNFVGLSKWMETFENKGLKVTFGKTKVSVSQGIAKDYLCESKVYQCWVCSLQVKADSVLCAQCWKWIHDGCVGVKMLTPKISKKFSCSKCEGDIGVAAVEEEQLCDEVETVRVFSGDRVYGCCDCRNMVWVG